MRCDFTYFMGKILGVERRDHLGKFDGKADEGFFVGYSINSKAFRVFNSRTRIVEENLHVQFRNQSNGNGGKMKTVTGKDYILLPLWPADPLFSQSSKSSPDAEFKPLGDDEKKVTEEPGKEGGDSSKEDERNDQDKDDNVNSTNNVNTASPNEVNAVGRKSSIELPDDTNMPELEDIVYSDNDEDVSTEANMNNLDAFMPVYRNKKDERGIMIKNKEILVAQGYIQEEGINYDEVFSLVTRIKVIRLFLAYASSKDFVVYQMDVKSAILYGKIEEKVYPLLKDENGEEVDVHLYRSMIGSLMYLTSSRPDIMFAVCACARYQVNPKVSHLYAMKRIFRHLKGQPKLGLWYPKDSPFDLVAYTDSDYAGASLDRKSTTGSCQFLGCRLISWQCKKQIVVANCITEAEYVAASSCYGQVLWIQNHFLDYRDSNEKKLIQMIKIQTDKNVTDLLTKAFDLQALVDGKKIIITEATVRRDLQLEDAEGIDCLPNADIFEQLTLIGMVKNLDNAGKFLMYPRFVQVFLYNQLEGMETDNKTYIAPSHIKKIFANIRRQGKDFSGRVTPLFPTMVVQAQEEMGEGSAMPSDPHHTHIITQPSSSQPQRKQKSKRSKRKDTKVPQPSDPINVTDEAVNEEPRITLDSTHFDADTDMFGVHDLDGDEVVVKSKVAAKKKDDEVNVVEEVVSVAEETVNDTIITEDEITLAQALAELKSVKPKDKGKGIMVEEPLKMRKKDQISFDEQEAIRLQAEFDKEVRLAREKDEANVALIEEWNDIQAKIDADYQMAKQMQEEEQKELRWKPKDLKNKSFANIQELFDKAMKRVNTFVDMDTELVEGSEVRAKGSEVRAEGSETREESSSKRAGDELEQEKAKKQKVDEDKETAKLQSLMEVIPDKEEVVIDAIPLATKPSSIVDWKILKEGNISYYQIIRANGSSKKYSAFIQMLRSFDREDLETLWKLVKAKHG
ncbi:putative ribonuclease H-like domain-containing protein [Tanacetum coccineum]